MLEVRAGFKLDDPGAFRWDFADLVARHAKMTRRTRILRKRKGFRWLAIVRLVPCTPSAALTCDGSIAKFGRFFFMCSDY
jgi:uncharacterized membrane protein YdjX (TVP38/TMEM64 family)